MVPAVVKCDPVRKLAPRPLAIAATGGIEFCRAAVLACSVRRLGLRHHVCQSNIKQSAAARMVVLHVLLLRRALAAQESAWYDLFCEAVEDGMILNHRWAEMTSLCVELHRDAPAEAPSPPLRRPFCQFVDHCRL